MIRLFNVIQKFVSFYTLDTKKNKKVAFFYFKFGIEISCF